MEATEQEVRTAPLEEEKTLTQNISELEDEASLVTSIDMNMVSEFVKDISGATTTRRLSRVRDAENRFAEAFLFIERFKGFTKTYDRLVNIFTNMHSDIEFDYFADMLSVLDESNQEVKDDISRAE